MDPIGIYDAKVKLSELIERVEAGEEVVITKRGKAVARLVPAEVPRRKSAARAAKHIRALCERLNVRGVKIRDLVAGGRDRSLRG
jgi:prevent-host-death family protein